MRSGRVAARVIGAALFTLGAVLCVPSVASAQADTTTWTASHGEQKHAYLRTIEMLDADGYRITAVDRTWLNRIKVRASKGKTRREIVISEATGMVLRDVIFEE